MNRRKILSWVGLGWLVSVLPSTLTACVADKQSKNSLTALAETVTPSPVSKSAVATSQNTRTIGSLAQLERDGQLIADGVIVVRDRINPQKLFAVNPVCTHKGCDVNWQKDRQEFVCPCHDATFAPDGSPRQFPAQIPLATYAVKVESEQVVIAGADTSVKSSSQRRDRNPSHSDSEREEREEADHCKAGKERKDQDCPKDD